MEVEEIEVEVQYGEGGDDAKDFGDDILKAVLDWCNAKKSHGSIMVMREQPSIQIRGSRGSL
jgi:protein subunit release factor B